MVFGLSVCLVEVSSLLDTSGRDIYNSIVISVDLFLALLLLAHFLGLPVDLPRRLDLLDLNLEFLLFLEALLLFASAAALAAFLAAARLEAAARCLACFLCLASYCCLCLLFLAASCLALLSLAALAFYCYCFFS